MHANETMWLVILFYLIEREIVLKMAITIKTSTIDFLKKFSKNNGAPPCSPECSTQKEN
jgi:hypothetical protein